MDTLIERFKKIKSNINDCKPLKPVNIIAVSKTFTLEQVKPLVEFGHDHLERIKYKKQS